MKLCTDCQHYTGGLYAGCARGGDTTSPVDGSKRTDYLKPQEERMYVWPFDFIARACGRRARFFKEKEQQQCSSH